MLNPQQFSANQPKLQHSSSKDGANWRQIVSLIAIGVGMLGTIEFLPGLCATARAQEIPPSGLYWTSANYGVYAPPPGLTGTSPYYSGLFRQTNCSLTDVVLDSTYTSVMKTPNYQDILHSESGSTTTGDKFAKGCPGPSTGITSGDIASLGKLPNGDTAYAVISTDNDGFTVYFFDSSYTATAQKSYTTISSSNPESAMFGFASADLNGDGIADVVVASETDPSAGTLIVFLGNGDGTFTQKQTINVPLVQGGNSAGPVIGVTIEDMNGDGKLDLIAVTNPPAANSGITVFLGNGDGTFPTTGIAGPAGAGGQTAVTADFNGDGKKDIATSYGQVLLGHGDGTFSLVPQSIPEGNGTAGIAAADFNQDGKMDLAFPHQSGTVIDVYFGKGDGTFTYSAAYPSITGDPSVQSSDLDGDGFPDLFVGYAQGGILSIQLNSNYFFQSILNQGDGAFGKSRAYFTGNSPANSFATLYDVADFSGDGKPDIVFVGSADGTATGTPNLTVLKNAGDGTFQLSGTQSSITGPDFVLSVSAIAAGDLTGSGKNDVVFAWGSSNEGTTPHLSVVLGNGDGTFQPQQDYSIPAQVVALLLVDVNGDKKPDAVLIASADGTLNSTGLYVMLNNGDGTFGQAKLIDSEPTMNYLAAQDVNGDGKTDIVVSTAGNFSSQPAVAGTGYLYLENGDGTFQHATSVNSGGLYSQVVAIADMNGDGKPDLVFAGTTATGSAGSVTVLLGKGNGTFQAGISTPAPGAPTGIVVADGNGDGKPDVIVGNGSSPYYLESNGDGTFNAANSGNFFVGVGSKNLKMADLTGQGLPSLLMTSGTTIQVFVAAPITATTKSVTSTSLTISPNPAAVGQSVTMTAQLAYSGSSAPTGNVAFMNGSTQLGTGTLNGNGKATYSTGSLVAGTYSVTAVYGGDTNFSGSTSTAVSLSVTSAPPPADFKLSASSGSLSITPGQSGTDTISVTPMNGFNQATSFACSGLPSEASCSFSPASVTPNRTAASTTTMTIATTAPTNSSRNIPAWPFGGGGIVAACGLFFLAKRKRLPSLVCLLLLLAIGGIAVGCGGGSKSSGSDGGGNSNPGTPAGTSTVTVTATAGSISHTAKITLTVQ